MPAHGHHGCHHVLAHCRECDVAYCTKCSREWGGHRSYRPSPGYPYPWFPSYVAGSPNRSVSAGDTTEALSVISEAAVGHVHSG